VTLTVFATIAERCAAQIVAAAFLARTLLVEYSVSDFRNAEILFNVFSL